MSKSTTDGDSPIRQEIGQCVLGLGLVASYLIIFTVGSQIPSPTLREPTSLSGAALLVLTYRESSVCLLAIIAACLGTWRRIYQASLGVSSFRYQTQFLAYTSACISGLISTALAVGLPEFLDLMSTQITISRDVANGAGPRNYVSMAMIASLIAFFSGYDKTFLDRVLAGFARKFAPPEDDAPTAGIATPAAAKSIAASEVQS